MYFCEFFQVLLVALCPKVGPKNDKTYFYNYKFELVQLSTLNLILHIIIWKHQINQTKFSKNESVCTDVLTIFYMFIDLVCTSSASMRLVVSVLLLQSGSTAESILVTKELEFPAKTVFANESMNSN